MIPKDKKRLISSLLIITGALNLKVEDKLYKAISGSGGTGGIKSVTNYAPVSICYQYITHEIIFSIWISVFQGFEIYGTYLEVRTNHVKGKKMS